MTQLWRKGKRDFLAEYGFAPDDPTFAAGLGADILGGERHSVCFHGCGHDGGAASSAIDKSGSQIG